MITGRCIRAEMSASILHCCIAYRSVSSMFLLKWEIRSGGKTSHFVEQMAFRVPEVTLSEPEAHPALLGECLQLLMSVDSAG